MKNKIGIIIIVYIILLVSINIFCRTEYDKTKNEYQALIINTDKNPQKLLNNIDGIINQKRALSFNKGEDNEIIYTPEMIYNSDGSTSLIDVDKNKLQWSKLYLDDNSIYAFSASDCNSSIGENEVILQLNAVDKKTLPYSNAISKDITFKYNNSLITLKIKDIVEADVYSNICISDELYNKLLPNEEKYIYELKFDKNKSFTKAEDILSQENLNISTPSKAHDTSNKESNLGTIIDILYIVNLITGVIIFIAIIYLIINNLYKKII